MYVSSSVFISVFSLNASIGFQLYCYWSFVYSVVPWFVFLSIFHVSVSACITAKIACMLMSLYLYFSLSLFLYLNVYFSVYIIIHCWYICTSLDPCYCLSFSVIVYICVRLYCHWLYVYRYISYFAFLSVFPSVFLSVRVYYHNLHVCKKARSCRSVYSSALENLCIIINSACIRTSTDSYFYLSLWLWMSVPVSGYVITDCMCIYVSWSCLFLSFSLGICSSVRLYCHWL